MQEAAQILTVMFMATFKFLFSGLVSFGLGNTFWETVLFTAIGGCIGAVAFYMLGMRVLEWFRVRYIRKTLARKAKGLPAKRIFTRTNRMIVRIKHRYGMHGLVVFSPPILSIPITSVLAAKYFKHDRRTLPTLISSVLVWSVVLTAMWSFIR